MINNKTRLCISISSSPSNLGAFFHNTLYKKLKINYLYMPMKVKKNVSLNKVITFIKEFNIKGCSVSMPHKIKIIKYLDKIDKTAKQINSINTILNKNNKLIGFNTDYIAVSKILSKINLKNKKILILGNGGMANVFKYYFSKKKIKITIVNRKIKKNGKQVEYIKFSSINNINFNNTLLINCTPIGMDHVKKKNLFKLKNLKQTTFVIDCVAKPTQTNLIRFCKKNKINFIPGIEISYLQSYEQFKIYTNLNIRLNMKRKYISYCEKLN